jgi:hypothetical protein
MIRVGSGVVSAEQKQVSTQVSSMGSVHVIMFIEQEMLFWSGGQEQAQAWVQKETEVGGSHFTTVDAFEVMMIIRRLANMSWMFMLFKAR